MVSPGYRSQGGCVLDGGTVEARPATTSKPRRDERAVQAAPPPGVPFAGPSIELIEPPLLTTRGASDLPVSPDSLREIIGR